MSRGWMSEQNQQLLMLLPARIVRVRSRFLGKFWAEHWASRDLWQIPNTIIWTVMPRGERPSSRTWYRWTETGSPVRRKRICRRTIPPQNVLQWVDKHWPGSQVPGFFAPFPGGQKEIKSVEDEVGSWGWEGEAREQFLPVIPPKLHSGGEWGRAEVGGSSGVAWLPNGGSPAKGDTTARGGATARQFTELPRPCCKFLVRRPWMRQAQARRPTTRPTKASQRQG